ncbi:MAG: ExbD/TolR family protein [Paracoccaceae bacterium]
MTTALRPFARPKSEREPTIALINIVFLMLIFFLVAGTIARPLDKDLKLVRTADLDGAAAADMLVAHSDGTLTWQGEPVLSETEFMAGLDDSAKTEIRMVPDRDLPATRMVEIARALRNAGAGKVLIVTQRGLE